MTKVLTKEEIMKAIAKYNVGDKVVYLNNDKTRAVGIVTEIEWTDTNEWNNKNKPLYLINNCPYLRSEKDVLEIYKDTIEDYKEVVAKYSKGDKVAYLDLYGNEKTGTITEVDHTDVSEWNKEVKPLYLMSSYPYLRSEDEVLEVCM